MTGWPAWPILDRILVTSGPSSRRGNSSTSRLRSHRLGRAPRLQLLPWRYRLRLKSLAERSSEQCVDAPSCVLGGRIVLRVFVIGIYEGVLRPVVTLDISILVFDFELVGEGVDVVRRNSPILPGPVAEQGGMDRAMREAAGRTQPEVGAALGSDQAEMSRLERRGHMSYRLCASTRLRSAPNARWSSSSPRPAIG